MPSPCPQHAHAGSSRFEVEKSTTSQFIVSVNVTPENVWYARTLM
jgi:hypothetical protein